MRLQEIDHPKTARVFQKLIRDAEKQLKRIQTRPFALRPPLSRMARTAPESSLRAECHAGVDYHMEHVANAVLCACRRRSRRLQPGALSVVHKSPTANYVPVDTRSFAENGEIHDYATRADQDPSQN